MNGDDREIRLDRMRYIKNTSSANLTYLGILFDVFFFVNIYRSDVDTYYYNILIGISIVYNLVFLLAAFLASEGAKNYKSGYTWLLGGLGIGQIIRIFIIPMRAHSAMTLVNGVETLVMQNGQFFRVIAYLVISGACLLVAAAINYRKCHELSGHLKSLGLQGA